MAGFKMHITTSTVLGVAYGAGAAFQFDVPLPACVLAGGLCSVSGMLPDLDSGPGVPLRESLSFAAAVVPMLLIKRFENMGLAPETIVLLGGAIYLFIRFGFGKLFTRFTVHRGMFHSIPAMVIAGQLAYLMSAHETIEMRAFNACAVMAGFASHLVLDEIYSIDVRRVRLKSSFGTAIKFWGDCWWANILAYVNVVILALLITQDKPANTFVSPEENPGVMAHDRDARDWFR